MTSNITIYATFLGLMGLYSVYTIVLPKLPNYTLWVRIEQCIIDHGVFIFLLYQNYQIIHLKLE